MAPPSLASTRSRGTAQGRPLRSAGGAGQPDWPGGSILSRRVSGSSTPNLVVTREEADGPGGRRAVVLISIDGLPAAVLDDPAIRLPHLRALAARGVRAASLRPVFPTVTWPCHTTLVTGVSPALHGVLGNVVLDRRSGALVSHYGDRTEAPVRVETLWDRAAWRASARRRCAGRRREPPSTWPTACPSSSTSSSSTRTAPGRSGPSSGPPGFPSSATRGGARSSSSRRSRTGCRSRRRRASCAIGHPISSCSTSWCPTASSTTTGRGAPRRAGRSSTSTASSAGSWT